MSRPSKLHFYCHFHGWVTTHGWSSGNGGHHGDACQFMKPRPSEFTLPMLAARTPDAVPNHPGSTNVQRAANVPPSYCVPCIPPLGFVCPSLYPTTMPTSPVVTWPPPHSRFASPSPIPTLTEDSPTPLPPTVLVNPFASFNTTSPLPHTTYPLVPTTVSPSPASRFSHPNPFAALESDDSDDDTSPHTPLLCSINPSPILADSGATHVLLRESVLPSLAHLMRPAQLPPIPFTLPN